IEGNRERFRGLGGWLLGDIPGGRDALRQMVHPALQDLVDELQPNDAQAVMFEWESIAFGARIGITTMFLRLHAKPGRFVGPVTFTNPALPRGRIQMLPAAADVGHIERIQRLAVAGRRPAAILFADLEASTPLAKRLPTATYFTLVRRLTRAFDRCVI